MNDVVASAVYLSSPSAGLRVEFASDLAALRRLREPWEKLTTCLSDHDAPFFQSYAWCEHVVKLRLQRSASRYRPLLASLWQDRELIGIWPLSVQRDSGAWIVKNLDDPFGQFAGVVFARREQIEPGVRAVIEAFRAGTRADGLQIESVVTDTPLHDALSAMNIAAEHTNDAVSVDLRAYPTMEHFLAGVNKKTRKNLRNLSSRLHRSTSVEHVIEEDRNRMAAIIANSFDGRTRWLKDGGRTSPAFRDPDFRALLQSLPEDDRIRLLGFSFNSPRDMISVQWGFAYLGRYYAYLSARNSSYDEFSPGRMHLGMVIESCKDRGIDVLELMAPPSDYKLSWTNVSKGLEVFRESYSLRGYWALQVLAQRLMPALRSVSRKLPANLRRQLVGALNRN